MAVDYTVGDRSSRCVASNVSGGGLFLTGANGLEPGEEVWVRFRPAKHLPIIQAKAIVRYKVACRGTAIEFIEISADDRHKLLRLIHQKTGDRKLLPRAPIATQVECDGCVSLAFSRDVSLAGLFIETKSPHPVGSSLTVRFNLNNKDRVVTATAVVAYHVEKMGMGISFTKIAPQNFDAIHAYVESIQDLPAKESPMIQVA